MSEFSKAQKSLSEIEQSLTTTTNFNRSTLLSYQEKVDSKLQSTALKYEAKLQETDVVSGEPRLGPQMQEKVMKFKSQVEAISALIVAKLAGKKHAVCRRLHSSLLHNLHISDISIFSAFNL